MSTDPNAPLVERVTKASYIDGRLMTVALHRRRSGVWLAAHNTGEGTSVLVTRADLEALLAAYPEDVIDLAVEEMTATP